MKSGFPSAVRATTSAWSGEAPARSSKSSASACASSSESRSSCRAVYAGSPPPQVGRSARSSGRESATRSSGTSRTRAASISMRSSRLASAQWMSSNSSIVGPRAASDSTSTRAEKKSVSRSVASPEPPSPISMARCSACASASSRPSTRSETATRSFRRASSSSSLSKICATCFTCWPKALYGMLAPYGVERPRSPSPPSDETSCASSSASRDFPIPDGPKTVTRAGRRWAQTSSQIRRNSAASWSRPTRGTGVSGRSPAGEVARSASHARTGSAFPFASIGGAGRNSIDDRVAE